jgi:hypothetical protein
MRLYSFNIRTAKLQQSPDLMSNERSDHLKICGITESLSEVPHERQIFTPKSGSPKNG